MEVGGVQSSVGWWKPDNKWQSESDGERFKAVAGGTVTGSQRHQRRRLQGNVNMRYPDTVPGVQGKMTKRLYTDSTMGSGGDRLVVKLVQHAMKRHKGNGPITVPCMPKGLSLNLKPGTKHADMDNKDDDGHHGWIQSNNNDEGASAGILEHYGVESIRFLARDTMTQDFFKSNPQAVIKAPDNQTPTQCRDFMKEMMQNEEDEAGGTHQTFASLQKKQKGQYCRDHAGLCGPDGEVDKTKISDGYSIVFSSKVLFYERSFIKAKRDTNTPFAFTDLKKLATKLCSGESRKGGNKSRKGIQGGEISPYDLPGQCAGISEAVLLIEGVFGEEGAEQLTNVLSIDNSWTSAAATYVFDAKEGNRLYDEHHPEGRLFKGWPRFNAFGTHKSEDAELDDVLRRYGDAEVPLLQNNETLDGAPTTTTETPATKATATTTTIVATTTTTTVAAATKAARSEERR